MLSKGTRGKQSLKEKVIDKKELSVLDTLGKFPPFAAEDENSHFVFSHGHEVG